MQDGLQEERLQRLFASVSRAEQQASRKKPHGKTISAMDKNFEQGRYAEAEEGLFSRAGRSRKVWT
jgi:hypothetical protein